MRALRGYLAHLRVERGLSPNTLAAYERDLSRYTDFLSVRGINAPAAVSEEDVSAFVEAIRAGDDGARPLAASSASRTVTAVRGWHRFLLAEGSTAVDPAAAVRPPWTTATGMPRTGRPRVSTRPDRRARSLPRSATRST